MLMHSFLTITNTGDRRRRIFIKTMNGRYLLVFSRQTADSKILLVIPVYFQVNKVICDESYLKRRKKREKKKRCNFLLLHRTALFQMCKI
jgi:hypothetical protein